MGGGGAQYVTTAGQLADFTLREFPRGNSHEPWRGLGTGCRDQRRPRQKTGSYGPGTLGKLLSARGTSGPSPASSSQASSLRADEAQDRPRELWWPPGGAKPWPRQRWPLLLQSLAMGTQVLLSPMQHHQAQPQQKGACPASEAYETGKEPKELWWEYVELPEVGARSGHPKRRAAVRGRREWRKNQPERRSLGRDWLYLKCWYLSSTDFFLHWFLAFNIA